MLKEVSVLALAWDKVQNNNPKPNSKVAADKAFKTTRNFFYFSSCSIIMLSKPSSTQKPCQQRVGNISHGTQSKQEQRHWSELKVTDRPTRHPEDDPQVVWPLRAQEHHPCSTARMYGLRARLLSDMVLLVTRWWSVAALPGLTRDQATVPRSMSVLPRAESR